MLASSLTLLGFAAAVMANDFPPMSKAKAYRLVVNVTDWYPSKTRDFDPPAHGLDVGRIQTGEGRFRVVAVAPGAGTVFFQNPHSEFFDSINAEFWMNTLTNGGAHVEGLQLEEKRHPRYSVVMKTGLGDEGQTLKPDGEMVWANPGIGGMFVEYMVCNTTVGGHYAIDAQHWTTFNMGYGLDLPSDCLRLKLLPQCETIENVVGDGLSDEVAQHFAKALDVRCYQDVRTIDWTKYRRS